MLFLSSDVVGCLLAVPLPATSVAVFVVVVVAGCGFGAVIVAVVVHIVAWCLLLSERLCIS